MENVENPLVLITKIENISPKDGRQMVNVDKILLELFHTC
jgi:hypothetical protein